VKDARQYTIPIDSALQRVRSGEKPQLTTREKHLRHCYVVPEKNADLKEITDKIKMMPYYFSDYETIVEFISEEELLKNHSRMPHGGFVLRSGTTGKDSKQLIEFSLNLDSNPEFTGTVLVAYARAAFRLNNEGQTGARTVFDIAPKYLSIRSEEELTRELL
jgi:diaminopimelate dehydrogenase